MFHTHPVPIVYATGPIRKPKPIKLITDPDGRIQRFPHTPLQSLPPQNHPKRPSMVRAATLDGRSLSEVIDAAHRASLNEQTKTYLSKSPTSIHERPSPPSRRTSFYYPILLGSGSSSDHHIESSSYFSAHRPDVSIDPYAHDSLPS